MHLEHGALLTSWKWGAIRDCPTVLIAIDTTRSTSLVENTVQSLFELHEALVPSGQVVVASYVDFSKWIETRSKRN